MIVLKKRKMYRSSQGRILRVTRKEVKGPLSRFETQLLHDLGSIESSSLCPLSPYLFKNIYTHRYCMYTTSTLDFEL